MDVGREDFPAAEGGTFGTEAAMGVGGAITDEMITGRRAGGENWARGQGSPGG